MTPPKGLPRTVQARAAAISQNDSILQLVGHFFFPEWRRLPLTFTWMSREEEEGAKSRDRTAFIYYLRCTSCSSKRCGHMVSP